MIADTVRALRSALAIGDMQAVVTQADALIRAGLDDDTTRGIRAAALLAAGHWSLALQALQALPDSIDHLHGMALACQRMGRLDDAGELLRRVLARDPADMQARRRLQMLDRGPAPRTKARGPVDKALRSGDLKRGFRLFAEFMEQQARPDHMPKACSLPRWRGEYVEHLLVLGLAGDGDTLQFCRYLPEAAKRCRRLSVAVSSQLVPLIRAQFPVAEVLSIYGSGQVDAVAQIEMMLLPCAVGATYGKTANYIHADAPRDYGPGFHVGINWTASDEDGNLRTVPVDMLEPLASVSGVTFHNLVFGSRAADAPGWIKPLPLGDYADTANAFAGLQLVITVDSSPAHLAGAMGLPVWVALPGPADWRFETHPHRWRWYETARLFRGPRCFESMAAMLGKLT